MKLHEALRKILKQFGTSVMQDGKRLMSMMADFHAFERAEITSSTSGISGSRLFRSFISVRNLPPTQWTASPLHWDSAIQ